MTNTPARQTRAEALQAEAEREVERLQNIVRQYEHRSENCHIGAAFGVGAGGFLGLGVSMGGPKILGISALSRGYSAGVTAAAGAAVGCKLGEWFNVRTWGAAQASEAEPVSPLRTPDTTTPGQQGQSILPPR